uniref:Gamma-secretase subunit APH-1 n=1 Tax=Naja naja TaxID=35670 RepID=A0A8C7E580_NAJNA
MGASVVFGCSFVAFGPALALCLLTMAGDPLRVLTLVAGAFYWLVSLLLASLVWFISVHLSDQEDKWLQHLLLMSGAAVSALLQEAFRFAHFKLLKRADEGLVTISEDGPFPVSTKQMASVSGLFFGIISGLFSIINILADSIGPGTVGIHGDSPYYFITSAFLIMALVFLHTFRGTIFFSACEKRHYWKLALAIVSHLVISGLTFLNPCYEARLIPIFLITICRGVGAFFTAGGSLSNILACLSCREKEDGHVMVYSELQLPVGDR